MKNLLILILLFFSFVWVNAQTEEQTLEWLNTKKAEVYDVVYHSSGRSKEIRN